MHQQRRSNIELLKWHLSEIQRKQALIAQTPDRRFFTCADHGHVKDLQYSIKTYRLFLTRRMNERKRQK